MNQVVSSRLNQLRKSPDKVLNSPEGQILLDAFEGVIEPARDGKWLKAFESLMPWLVREFKQDRICITEKDGKLQICRQGKKTVHRLPVRYYAQWFGSSHPSLQNFNIMAKSPETEIDQVWKRVKQHRAWVKQKRLEEKQKQNQQGKVVYTFEDGWSIQQLLDEEKLDWEGGAQEFCLGDGDYDQMVNDGRILVFSLRDEKGNPHVTLDVTPKLAVHKKTGCEQSWKNIHCIDGGNLLPIWQASHINNIYGPKDSVPKKEYLARIKEWMNTQTPHRRIGSSVLVSIWKNQSLFDENNTLKVTNPTHQKAGFVGIPAFNISVLFKNLNLKDQKQTDDRLAWLSKACKTHGYENSLRHQLYSILKNKIRNLGPEADWEVSDEAQKMEHLFEVCSVKMPDIDKMYNQVLTRALHHKGKSSLSKEWRKHAKLWKDLEELKQQEQDAAQELASAG